MWTEYPASIDHAVFAPLEEAVTVTFKPRGKKRFRVRVEDSAGTDVLTEVIPKDGTQFVWDGRLSARKEGDPPRYASPLGSPYLIHIEMFSPELASRRNNSASLQRIGGSGVSSMVLEKPAIGSARPCEVEVKVKSIKLEMLPWADAYKLASGQESTDYPGDGPLKTMWLRYKLNELGFFAGPIVKEDGADLANAIGRYRQSRPGLYKKLLKLDASCELQEYVDPLPDFKAVDGPLIDDLKAGAGKRDVVEPDVFSKPNDKPESKLFVDIERYYMTPEELLPGEKRLAPTTRNAIFESEWLTRPTLPLKATVYLEASDGSEKIVPEALADFSVAWSWSDQLEASDYSGARDDQQRPLPLPTRLEAQPSMTDVYVDTAMRRATARVRSKFRNATEAVGGIITGNAKADKAAVFAPFGAELFPFDTVALREEKGAKCRIRSTRGAPDSANAAACVWFTPSLIAGDNYRVTATLAARQVDDEVRLANPPSASSGRVVVWRRLRIAAHISWPTITGQEWNDNWNARHGSTTGVRWDEMWKQVQRTFAHAFVEVIQPQFTGSVTDAVPDFAERFKRILIETKAKFTDKGNQWEAMDPNTFVFNPDYYFPKEPPVPTAGATTNADAINQRVFDILQPEIDAWTSNSPPPEQEFATMTRQKEAKRVVGFWTTENVDPVLNANKNDPLLVDAARHFNDALAKMVKTIKRNYAQCDKVVFKAKPLGWKEFKPYNPSQLSLNKIRRGESFTATDKDAIHQRIMRLLGQELVDYVNTDVVNDPPQGESDAPNLTAVYNLVEKWTSGKDEVAVGIVGDQVLSNLDSDVLIAGAGTHYRAELAKISECKGTKTEIKEDRTDYNPNCPRYAPSAEFLETVRKGKTEKMVERVHEFIKKTQVQFLRELEAAIYANHGPGIIILDYFPHPPVNVGVRGPHDQFLTAAFAQANGNGLVMIDQVTLRLYKWYHLFAHEVAHCVFLRHWKNSQGFEAMDHDHADDNCIMSYAFEKGFTTGRISSDKPHYEIGKYAPDFCGKCNLKLRGWNLRAKTGERDSAGKPIDLLPSTSDTSVPFEIPPDVLVPNVYFTKVERSNLPKIPSPTMTHQEADALLKDLLGEQDVERWWMNHVDRPNVIGVVANPRVVESPTKTTIEWEALPAISIPEGTEWPATTDKCVFPTKPKDSTILQWQESLEFFAGLGGRNTTRPDGLAGLQLNLLWPYGNFTDMLHETCHFFQNWNSERWMNESITDIFGCMLSLRLKRRIQGTHPQYVQRFNYVFNPSYMESVLCGIEQWLPRLGLRGLARLYIKAESLPLDNLMKGNKTTTLDEYLRDSKALAARKLYKDGPMADGDVVMVSATEFRPDIQKAIDDVSDRQLCDDLKTTILAYFADLEQEFSQACTSPKQEFVTALNSPQWSVKRLYHMARLCRNQRKQHVRSLEIIQTRKFVEEAKARELVVEGSGPYLTERDSMLTQTLNEPIEMANQAEKTVVDTRKPEFRGEQGISSTYFF